MGAKACKCNLSGDEEQQLKLSREPAGDGKYEYPSEAGPKDVAVSALEGSTAGNVAPLQPIDARGADAAAGGISSSLSAGKLPTVLEASGEEQEQSRPDGAETASDAGRPEQIAELKEALLECVGEDGNLATEPSEAQREALSAKSSIKKTTNGIAGEAGNGHDVALPAAAQLALSHSHKNDRSQDLQAGQVGVVTPEKNESTAGEVPLQSEASKPQYDCWSLGEKNANPCLCPDGSGSLELRRDGRTATEHYEVQGTANSAVIPQGVSALSKPPEAAKAELDRDPTRSQPDESSVMPPPESPKQPDILRDAAREPALPAEANVDIQGMDPHAQHTSPAKVDGNPAQEEGLNGEWINDTQINIVQGDSITFASGEKVQVEPTSTTTCHMVLEGTVFYGRLSPDRQKLLWSDGDVWIRKKNPSAESQAGTAKSEANAACESEGAEASAAKLLMLDEVKDDSEEIGGALGNQGEDTPPPKRGLCRCFGGGKKAKAEKPGDVETGKTEKPDKVEKPPKEKKREKGEASEKRKGTKS
jgi:hypothetical protein